MKRRGFFKSLAALAAVVAIAPEIAFRTKLKIQEPEIPVQFWYKSVRTAHINSKLYDDYLRWKHPQWGENPNE